MDLWTSIIAIIGVWALWVIAHNVAEVADELRAFRELVEERLDEDREHTRG